MNCWKLLGLAPTVDTRPIRKAYAALLRTHHPEDDPQGFQALRQAYEEALEASRRLSAEELAGMTHNQDETREDARTGAEEDPASAQTDQQDQTAPRAETPHEQANTTAHEDADEAIATFMARAAELYQDFGQRIRVEAWRDLLNDDVMWNLEAKSALSLNLFNAISKAGNVPGEVFGLLDEIFGWLEQERAFARRFSEEQVAFVFGSIVSRDWSLGYRGLEHLDAEQGDTFIHHRHQGHHALRSGEPRHALEHLKAAQALAPHQPDLLWLLSSAQALTGAREAACESLSTLLQWAPETSQAQARRAQLAFEAGDYTRALGDYQQALANMPDMHTALRGVADCYFQLGELASAKALYEQLSDKLPYDIYTQIQLVQVNQALLQEYRTQLDEKPRDPLLIHDMAEVLYELKAYTECIEFLKSRLFGLPPGHKSHIRILYGRALRALGEDKEAGHSFKLAYEQARAVGENGYEALLALVEQILEGPEPWDALPYLQEAREHFPKASELHYMMGQVAWHNARRAQNQTPYLEEALEHYNEAIRLTPTLWYYYDARARTFNTLQRRREESRDLEQALTLHVNSNDLWERLGHAYCHLKKYAKAKAAYDHTSRPDLHLGYLYLEAKDYEQCIRVLDRYLADHPDNDDAHFYRARAHMALGHYEQAMSDFEQAMALDHHDPYLTWWLRSQCAYKKGDIEVAEEGFLECMDIDADYRNALRWLGKIWREQKAYEKAITYCNQNEHQLGAFYERALCFLQTGLYQAAHDDLRFYLSRIEHDAQARLHMGTCYRLLGKPWDAIDAFNQARRDAKAAQGEEQADPDAVDVQTLFALSDYHTALCYCQMGDFVHAQRLLQRARKGAPDDTRIKTQLANIPGYMTGENMFETGRIL